VSDIAIRVEDLCKRYPIGGPQGRYRYKSLREELIKTVEAPFRRLSSVVRGQSPVVSNETIWPLKEKLATNLTKKQKSRIIRGKENL